MQILRTKEFDGWLRDLKDFQAKSRIAARLDRLQEGNPGQTRSVGEGVFELKIDFGPGYRVYYIERGAILTIILCGGDKSTQTKDIQRAKGIARQLFDEEDEHAD
jgi:putative addiction module killer protein